MGFQDNTVIKTWWRMRNLVSFSTKTIYWACLLGSFSIGNPFSDLICINHHLIHSQKCQHCGFSILFSIVWKKIFIANLHFLTDLQIFIDASLKSNSPYFFLNKKINFSKNKTESEMEILTQTSVKNLTSAHIRIKKIKLKP